MNVQSATKKLTVSAVLIALGTIASLLKIAKLPFGGSVTCFSMLFITLIAYFYGAKIGIISGVVYGLIQLIMEPYILVPLQVILDYPMPFAALGIAGFFKNKKKGLVVGYVAGCMMRYVFHVISGYLFFKEYTPEGWNAELYAIAYNATYIFPEMILTAVILMLPMVYDGIERIKRMANN